MKRLVLLLIAVLVTSFVILPLAYFSSFNQEAKHKDDSLFFGVTYGQDTVEGAELLIDKVHNYTNVFVVNSFNISNNKTALDEVCSYAVKKNLHFLVYFFSLYASDWERDWVITANQTWGDKFLGVYLRDEPGGRQIESNESVKIASSYSEAAQFYIQNVSSYWSNSFLNDQKIPLVTSDFALYWFDYKAGFDIIFAELGWNNSRPQEIGLCRGAAAAQGKNWGAMIAWTYQQPPYIGTGPEIYSDMITAYEAGAKYILVFNHPEYPEGNPYGLLKDEHFEAMQQFWNCAKTSPRDLTKTKGEVALVLPKDYGWGMRWVTDKIWGLWEPDDYSPLIWKNVNALINRYGIKLDIIYENGTNFTDRYAKVYFWNETIT
jgi:hypothetical protein